MVGFVIATVAFAAALVLSTPFALRPWANMRPMLAERRLDALTTALQAYFNDHGAFPPEEPLFDHWTNKKNFIAARGSRLTTFQWHRLTTPVAYLPEGWDGDPYSVPEQAAPPAYAVFADGVFIWSPGPNLKYEIDEGVLARLRAMPPVDHLPALNPFVYDPTNGTRSAGDLLRGMAARRPGS